MRLSMKKVVAGVGALAITGGMILASAGAASAAAPSFEPDPNSVGSLSFYDSSGHVVTTGSINDSPQAAFYAASGGGIQAGDTAGQIAYATPQDGVPTGNWPADTPGSTHNFVAPASLPGDLTGTTNAVIPGASGDFSIATYLGEFPLASTTNPGILEVRFFTGGNAQKYYNADIKITGTTWTQVFPVPVVGTTTTLTSSEPTGATTGDNITFTATETAADSTHPAGSVQFKDNGTNIGTGPVAVNASGVAPLSISTLSNATHTITAVFTPSVSGYSGSTGTLSQLVSPPAPPTTTTLAADGHQTTAGSDTKLTATVLDHASAPLNAGSVSFFDNGSTSALGTVAGSTNTTPGQYVLDLTSGFAAGPHSVVAVFTPTDSSANKASTSQPITFITQAVQVGACASSASACTDTQNIQGTIPVGTLKIFTPYTATNPLDLGTLALNSGATEFTANAQFTDINIVDGRSGGLGWTVTAQSSNLTDGSGHTNGVINSQNVGLTNLANHPGIGFTGTVTTTANPAADPAVAPAATGALGLGGTAPHTVAVATVGVGTDDLNGLLTLNAPTSTEAGLFTGTITFTVG
jgi:hypothetical protein